MANPLPVLSTPCGVSVTNRTQVFTDWASIKVLIESGVPFGDVAAHFKYDERQIRRRAADEKWLTPAKVESMRKEIMARQSETFARSGKAANVLEVKASIWAERGEAAKEKLHKITKASLEACEAVAIESTKDLKDILEITRTLSGEAKTDEKVPTLAINIGLLRSARPTDIIDI